MKKRTVLFVDDDEKFLKSLEKSFIDETYTTLFAVSGKDALEIMKQQEVHVLVTDMRMLDMSGLELLKIAKNDYPDIVKMALSGYMPVNTVLSAVNDVEVLKFLTKPCDFTEILKPAVLEALDHYESYSKCKKPVKQLK